MNRKKSIAGKLVTLIGGSGYVGTHVAQALLRSGARVKIACRHPERAFHLKPLSNLGQLQFVPCAVENETSLQAALYGADAAIYLVGSFGDDMAAVQIDGPARSAQIARDHGTQAFTLFSALGADNTNECAYSQTKGLGEEGVLSAFPKATILRPSVMFSTDDKFINMFAGLIAKIHFLPVFGPEAKLQLLHVDDAAEAALASITNTNSHGGKIYELGGPEAISMMKLHQMIAAAQHRKRHFIPMPDTLSAIIAALPGTPLNRDQWKMLQRGSVASGKLPTIDKMGINPRPLAASLNKWMVQYRQHGRFGAGFKAG